MKMGWLRVSFRDYRNDNRPTHPTKFNLPVLQKPTCNFQFDMAAITDLTFSKSEILKQQREGQAMDQSSLELNAISRSSQSNASRLCNFDTTNDSHCYQGCLDKDKSTDLLGVGTVTNSQQNQHPKRQQPFNQLLNTSSHFGSLHDIVKPIEEPLSLVRRSSRPGKFAIEQWLAEDSNDSPFNALVRISTVGLVPMGDLQSFEELSIEVLEPEHTANKYEDFVDMHENAVVTFTTAFRTRPRVFDHPNALE